MLFFAIGKGPLPQAQSRSDRELVSLVAHPVDELADRCPTIVIAVCIGQFPIEQTQPGQFNTELQFGVEYLSTIARIVSHTNGLG